MQAPLTDSDLHDQARDHLAKLPEFRDILLANVVFCGEIPSPTFGEQERIRWLVDRFTASELETSTDEVDNVAAILPGTDGQKNILVTAHTDTIWQAGADHTVSAREDRLTGIGLADNSLGVAAAVSLPVILDGLGLKLRSNLVLLGDSRSLGRGNLEGVRFFLDNTNLPIHAGVCVEGAQLGRLSHSCLGMMRGEVAIKVPDEQDWKQWTTSSAIVRLNHVVSRILAIPRPEQPRTQILLGSVSAGTSYNTPPERGILRFEVRSENAEVVRRIQDEIEEIVQETNARGSAQAVLSTIARREPGDLGFSHPMIRSIRGIMDALKIDPLVQPSMSELSALLDHDIPGVTLGLTRSDHVNEPDECIHIEPMFRGLAQLIASLQAIDEFVSHEQ